MSAFRPFTFLFLLPLLFIFSQALAAESSSDETAIPNAAAQSTGDPAPKAILNKTNQTQVVSGKAALSFTIPSGYLQADGLHYEAEFAGTGASMHPEAGILAAYVPEEEDKAFKAAKAGGVSGFGGKVRAVGLSRAGKDSVLKRCLLISTTLDKTPGMKRTLEVLRQWLADPEFFYETYSNEAGRIAVPGLTREVMDYELRSFRTGGPGEFSLLYTMSMESAVGSGDMLTYGVFETMFLVEDTLFTVRQYQVLDRARDVEAFGKEAAALLSDMEFQLSEVD